MHDLACSRHHCAEAIANALVPQANAQDGNVRPEVANDLIGDARSIRGARPGGDHDALWLQLLDLRDGYLIIAHHMNLLSQFTEVLEEVVGEAVVVIDKQQHFIKNPPPARWP